MRKTLAFFTAAMFFAVPFVASAATLAELQAQLQALLVQVSVIQGGSYSAPSSSTTTTQCPSVIRNFSRGSRGADVALLQNFFVSNGLLSADSATGFFGALTERALQSWQCSSLSICSGTPSSNGYGAVGPRTRAALKKCSAFSGNNPGGITKPIGIPPVQTPPIGGGGSGGTGGGAISPQPVTYNWLTSAWSSCVNNTQSRTVTCVSSQNQSVADSLCSSTKPAGSQSCSSSAPAPLSCTFNNQPVAHGASVEAYQAANVPAGQSCVSETRICANGALSGSYTNASCAVAQNPTSLQVTPSGHPYSLKSAFEAIAAMNLTSDITVSLADGVYDMNLHSNDTCGGVPCITYKGIANPSLVKIIGNVSDPSKVVFRFSKPASASAYWPGGFYLYEQKTYGLIDGITLEGPYNGWTDRQNRIPDQTPYPAPENITFTTMGLWARNGAQVTLGQNVRIKGFYFGVAAEGPGTYVNADGVKVENCGDAAFIAWTGATLHANDTEASWCAAYGWGLGTGYVSETTNPHDIGAYSDSDPSTDDAAIRSYRYVYASGSRASVETPLLQFVQSQITRYGARSRVIADRAISHDHLLAGYIANIGGHIQMNNALAFRNGIANTTVTGATPLGGVIAQVNGTIEADGAVVYHNGKYGFVSLLGSTINAPRSKVFGNTWHGFYALEEGSVIRAQGASSFSFGANQMFGFGAERNSTMYIDTVTKAGATASSFSFFDPITSTNLTVNPQANINWDFSPTINTTGNTNASILRQ